MAMFEKLERLRATKQDIKAAIVEKGQDVGEIPFSAYPDKIRAIGGGAENEDEILASILDDSVETINIPAQVTKIRSMAFYDCGSLRSVTFPAGLISIEVSAFSRCKVNSPILPDGLQNIGTHAFSYCSVGFITFPASLKTIGLQAFQFASLRKVTFLGKPDTIGASAFTSNSNLKHIYVPWARGEVPGSPWGATAASIHYNYTGE